MMRIGAESGRYEVVLYSELSYFEMALAPIEEWTPQTQALIKRIEEQCNITKRHVYSYTGMLKRYANLGYVFVDSVF